MKKLMFVLICMICMSMSLPSYARNLGWVGEVSRIFDGKTTAPTVIDDASKGYEIGDVWIDETNDKAYVCVDNAAGAAVWRLSGFVTSSGDIDDVTIGAGGSGVTVEKMWITDVMRIPIEWGINGVSPPDAAAVVVSGVSEVARTFASSATEDLDFTIIAPEDIVAAKGIKFQVLGVITNATGPGNEGFSWDLSGHSVGDNDAVSGSFGTAVESGVTGTYSQYDSFESAWSGTVTVTNLAAGEKVKLKLERDHDDDGDDYGQSVGATWLILQYVRELTYAW